MAKGGSNWIWWTIGGVTLLGLGVGAYIFFKDKKQKKQAALDEAEASSNVPSSTPAYSAPAAPATSYTPFKNKAEGDAFRAWVNDNYPAYAKEISLDRSGKYDNSTIGKAWNKYGSEYSKKGSASSSSSGGSTWSTIKSQMTNSSIWSGNSRVSDDSLDKLQIGVDVDGFYDVYANFTPSGGFWIEKTFGDKYGGTWSFSNSQFTLKLNDGTYSGSDSNIGKLVKAAMKVKYPSEMKYYSFENSSDMDDFMHNSKVDFVDSNDTLL